MKLLETVLVAGGLSLDICAVMICYGALLPEIKNRTLILGCVILSVWQLIAFQAGNLLTYIPIVAQRSGQVFFIWSVFSILIFWLLGGYMFHKASERKPFIERRKDHFSIKEIWILAAGSSLDVFFAGIGMGCLNAKIWPETAAVFLGTVGAIVVGIYVGYRFGYEQKGKAYVIGGILMVAAGAEVVFRCL